MPPCRHPVASTLFADLAAGLRARPRNWVDDLPAWVEAGTPETYKTLIVGSRSYFDWDGKVKIGWALDAPWTCHELARPYLNAIFAEQKATLGMGADRVPFTRAALGFLDLPAPLYVRPSDEVGELAYVDITAAFTAIYRVLTLDLRYEPDADPPRLGVGRISFLEPEELAAHRGARLSVVGVTRARQTYVLRYGAPLRRPDGCLATWKIPNRLLAPDLWGLIAHTLHAIAAEMVERFEARYVHTDGYILAADRAGEALAWLAQRWRVPATVRAAGLGYVRGVSDWAVGGSSYGGVTPDYFGERPNGRPIDNLITLAEELTRRLAYWRAVWVDRAGAL